MKTDLHNHYQLLMTILMSIFTMFKIHFLYLFTLLPANAVVSYVRTGILLLFLYTLLHYIFFRKSFRLRLFIHELLAFIIFADMMYFSYFNTLPSVNELQMLQLLPEVWDSIADLFKLQYLLLFADSLILTAIHFMMKTRIIPNCPRKPSLAALLLACLILLDSFGLKGVNSYEVFNRFGLLHFHLRQTSEILMRSDKQKAEANLLNSLPHMQSPASSKYHSTAKGRNVIVIQAEALQNFIINRSYNGQELTPNLNKLIAKNTLYFDRYYQNTGRGNTADAEFVSLHSLYPAMKIPSYTKYQGKELYGLPKILKSYGYTNFAFHAYKPEFWNRNVVYPLIGFDRFYSEKDYTRKEIIGWGASDSTFFRQSVSYLQQAPQPFFGFMITLSSHHPFNIPAKYKKIKLEKEHQNTLFGNYINSIHYADYSIGVLIDSLKQNGLYHNTIIAVYGDHQGIFYLDNENQKLVSDFLGHQYDADDMANIPLIIHMPNSRISERVSIAGGPLDFAPTLLNLLGIQDQKTKFYGQDLCNAEKGFAPIQLFLPKGSFVENDKVYIATPDGIFEHGRAWEYKTKQPIDLELCRPGYQRAMTEIDQCDYLLTNDLLYKEAIPEKTSEITKQTSFYVNFKQQLRQIILIALDNN